MTSEKWKALMTRIDEIYFAEVDKRQPLLTLLEDTANMLRGMTMDPTIPAHAKEAIRHRIATLESTVERYLNGRA